MKRLNYLDECRGFGMLCVFTVHIFGASGLGDNPLCTWITSFVMGLFFYLSGVLMCIKKEEETAPPAFLTRKAAGYLKPYLLWSLIALLLRLLNAKLVRGVEMADFILLLRAVFTGTGFGTLWFLPAGFVGTVLAFFIRRAGKKRMEYADFGSLCSVLLSVFLTYRFQILSWDYLGPVLGYESSAVYDVIYVLVRGVIAAGFINGAYLCRRLESISVTQNQKRCLSGILFLAISCFTGQRIHMDFRTLQFSGWVFFIIPQTTLAYFGIRYIFETLEACLTEKSLLSLSWLREIGKNTILCMTSHEDWFLAGILWNGVCSVFRAPGALDKRAWLLYAMALGILILTELSLIRLMKRVTAWRKIH